MRASTSLVWECRLALARMLCTFGVERSALILQAEGKQGQGEGLLVSPLVDRGQDGVQYILGEVGIWPACIVDTAA